MGDLKTKAKDRRRYPERQTLFLEKLIVKEGERTGYRYRRLTEYMSRKYGLKISENTVKAILKRNGIKKKQRRTGNGKVRDLYDYEHIEPFVEFQLDTKHLLDFKSLPKEVYEHMQRYKLPKYEWNLVDTGTRTRFTAYSYELNAAYGYMFIGLAPVKPDTPLTYFASS